MIPRNSVNFGIVHPGIDSNSGISNSMMYFLDKNACYLRTCCIPIVLQDPKYSKIDFAIYVGLTIPVIC